MPECLRRCDRSFGFVASIVAVDSCQSLRRCDRSFGFVASSVVLSLLWFYRKMAAFRPLLQLVKRRPIQTAFKAYYRVKTSPACANNRHMVTLPFAMGVNHRIYTGYKPDKQLPGGANGGNRLRGVPFMLRFACWSFVKRIS